jgi:hypothetical protein
LRAAKRTAQFEADRKSHLREAAAENTVVIVGDVDMLTDGAASRSRNVGPASRCRATAICVRAGPRRTDGRRQRADQPAQPRGLQPSADGDQADGSAGSGNLSRQDQAAGRHAQPDHRETAGAAEGQGFGQRHRRGDPAAEQQAELENFRKKSIETRKELKDVRKNLREETEALQLFTKIINIALVPLLVMLLGVGLAISKRRKANARIRAS